MNEKIDFDALMLAICYAQQDKVEEIERRKKEK